VRKLLGMLVLCVLAAMAACATYYAAATRETSALLSQPGGEMEWLRHEFRLSDAQFGHIKAAHEAYQPTCEELCGRIARAHVKLRELMAAGDAATGVTPQMRAALAECAAVEMDCRAAMLEHIQTVSGFMDPASAARFRRMMEERMMEPGKPAQMMFKE